MHYITHMAVYLYTLNANKERSEKNIEMIRRPCPMPMPVCKNAMKELGSTQECAYNNRLALLIKKSRDALCRACNKEAKSLLVIMSKECNTHNPVRNSTRVSRKLQDAGNRRQLCDRPASTQALHPLSVQNIGKQTLLLHASLDIAR